MPPETAPAPEPLRVALVEDDRRFRDGLGMLIDGSPGFRLVGSFGSVEEARVRACPEAPEVVLLDIHLPGVPGSDGVVQLIARWPQVVVLMLTVFEEDDHVFTSLCNGAVGYLLKSTPPASLLEALRDARQGGSPMSPEIARKVIRRLQRTPPPEPLGAALTEQEIRLLALLAEGASYQAAGERLYVSINTVRSRIRSIYEKLQVHTKSEAVSKAFRAGLI